MRISDWSSDVCSSDLRVLLWHHFVVPNWHTRTDRIVYWDTFGYPATPPANGTSTSYWWFDEAKAYRIERSPDAHPYHNEGDSRDNPCREICHSSLHRTPPAATHTDADTLNEA